MLTFWFEFASTYSYIAAERLRASGEVPPRTAWRTFLLGPIFQAMGWDTSPFNIFPAKGAYMWRDVERLAAREGLSFHRPTQFPRNGLLAARVASAHAAAGWLPAFVCGVYRAEFADDADIADPAVVRSVLLDVGAEADAVLAAAESERAKAALRASTEEAGARGIFGAPSFTVGDELFWGQDRIDDALAWRSRPQS